MPQWRPLSQFNAFHLSIFCLGISFMYLFVPCSPSYNIGYEIHVEPSTLAGIPKSETFFGCFDWPSSRYILYVYTLWLSKWTRSRNIGADFWNFLNQNNPNKRFRVLVSHSLSICGTLSKINHWMNVELSSLLNGFQMKTYTELILYHLKSM